MNHPKIIILHCSATIEGKNFRAADIRRWHRAQGWSDIGYHYVVALDGTIELGRAEMRVGAHCSGHNTDSLGICYIGGLDKNSKAKDTRTDKQKESLLKIVHDMMQKYKIPLTQVYCHNQFARKACPSFKIDTFRNEYKQKYPNE